MSEHSERLVRIETKLDDLIILRLEDRAAAKVECQAHKDWTAALTNRIQTIETHNTYLAGAGSIITIGMGAFMVAAWEKIKLRMGW